MIYRLKITLMGFRPPIWRRVEVDGNISLGELHEVIQIAMGWEDAHLHQFIVDDTYYSTPYPGMEDWEIMEYMRDANEISLQQVAVEVGVRFIYKYDFGDSWEHRIRVEQIKEPEAEVLYPVCLTGKRACPPEDVGGVWGYEECLSALQNKNHPEHDRYSEWIGEPFDPENFDLEESNRMLSYLDFYKVFKREKALVYTDRQGQYLNSSIIIRSCTVIPRPRRIYRGILASQVLPSTACSKPWKNGVLYREFLANHAQSSCSCPTRNFQICNKS